MSKTLDRLTLLANFARIAERGSISAAARDQNISQASSSRQLAELEARLAVSLIHRTTHTLALTEAGHECLAEARRLLSSWEALAERFGDEDAKMTGRLKIVAPVALGQLHLVRAALHYQKAHPGVSLTWLLEDEPIRFSEIGCDLWVRIGPVPDETLVVQPLGHVERMIVASPALLKGAAPEHPSQLAGFPCAALTPFEGSAIRLNTSAGETHHVTPNTPIATNNIFSAYEAAKMGTGFAVMPRWFVQSDLQSGALIDILPEWRAAALPINAAFLPAQRQTRRLRLFREHMQTAVTAIEGITA